MRLPRVPTQPRRNWLPWAVTGASVLVGAGALATIAGATFSSPAPQNVPVTTAQVPTPGGLVLPSPGVEPSVVTTIGTTVPQGLVGLGAGEASDRLRHAGFSDVLFLNSDGGTVLVPHDNFQVVSVPVAGTRVNPDARLTVWAAEIPPAPSSDDTTPLPRTFPQDTRICATYVVPSLDDGRAITGCEWDEEVREKQARGELPTYDGPAPLG